MGGTKLCFEFTSDIDKEESNYKIETVEKKKIFFPIKLRSVFSNFEQLFVACKITQRLIVFRCQTAGRSLT